jgi:hypothetical protein
MWTQDEGGRSISLFSRFKFGQRTAGTLEFQNLYGRGSEKKTPALVWDRFTVAHRVESYLTEWTDTERTGM